MQYNYDDDLPITVFTSPILSYKCHWVFSSKLLRKLKQKHLLFNICYLDENDDEINNVDQPIPLDSPPLPPSLLPPPSSYPFVPSPSFPQRRQWYSPPSSTWSRWTTRGRAPLQNSHWNWRGYIMQNGDANTNDVGVKMGKDKNFELENIFTKCTTWVLI